MILDHQVKPCEGFGCFFKKKVHCLFSVTSALASVPHKIVVQREWMFRGFHKLLCVFSIGVGIRLPFRNPYLSGCLGRQFSGVVSILANKHFWKYDQQSFSASVCCLWLGGSKFSLLLSLLCLIYLLHLWGQGLFLFVSV